MSQNKAVVFPAGRHKIGDFVRVEIISATQATLIGREVVALAEDEV